MCPQQGHSETLPGVFVAGRQKREREWEENGRGQGRRGKRKKRPSLLVEKLGNVGLAAAQTCAEGWFERGHRGS